MNTGATLMKLSNAFLIYAVWAIALTMLAASFAAAQPPDTPVLHIEGWDITDTYYMVGDVTFNPAGKTVAGAIWLLDSDRTPVADDDKLDIGIGGDWDDVLQQFEYTALDGYFLSTASGFATITINPPLVDPRIDADWQTHSRAWIVPEASACALLLMGLVCLAVGRRR